MVGYYGPPGSHEGLSEERGAFLSSLRRQIIQPRILALREFEQRLSRVLVMWDNIVRSGRKVEPIITRDTCLYIPWYYGNMYLGNVHFLARKS